MSAPDESTQDDPVRRSGLIRTGQLIRSALRKFSWKRDWADDDDDPQASGPKVVARVSPTKRHEDPGLSRNARVALIVGVVILIGVVAWIGTRLASPAPITPDALF